MTAKHSDAVPRVNQNALHQLLESVKDALERGRSLPQPASDPDVRLFATSAVAQLLDASAGPPERHERRQRRDLARDLQPALASNCPLVGVVAERSLLVESSAGSRAVRQRLLSERRLLAVASLPPGLLRSSGVGLCLLLLVPAGTADAVTVLDVDAEGAGFVETTSGRRQRTLVDLDRLAAALVNGAGGWWVARVPTHVPELAESLDPRRYVRSPLEKQIDRYFSAGGELRLGDVLDAVSPMPNTAPADAHLAVQVVRAADLPRLGLVESASGRREISSDTSLRGSHRFLRAGDVLVSYTHARDIRIAVVPDTVPAPGSDGWIAARTVWAYRPASGNAPDPRALAVMLASPLGRFLLHSTLATRDNVTPPHAARPEAPGRG